VTGHCYLESEGLGGGAGQHQLPDQRLQVDARAAAQVPAVTVVFLQQEEPLQNGKRKFVALITERRYF